jgi:S1-C subfamily serine protease
MAIRIACPSCKSAYTIDDALRGRQIVCRQCQKPMLIPALTAVKPAPRFSTPNVSSKSDLPGQDDELEPLNAASVVRHGRPTRLLWLIGGELAALLLVVFVGVAAVYSLLPSKAVVRASDTPPAVVAAPVKQDDPSGHVTDEPAEPKAAPKPDDKTDLVAEIKPIPKKPKEPPQKRPDGDGSGATAGNGQLSRQVLDKVKKATVYLRVTLPDGTTSQGSGFFGIEPGLVLTNAHVLGMLNADSAPPRKVEIVYQSGEPDSRKFTGKILGVDRTSDLALLRVTGDDLPEPLEVKTATDLIETQTVYVVGFPFGDTLGKNITVSQSSVSSLRKGSDGQVVKVQVNGGMHPGNSGGPVVTTSGEVVGVAVSIVTGTQVNFAVPGEHVHQVYNGRIAGVTHGITVREGGKVKMPILIEVLDPLDRVQKVACEWWTAQSGDPRPATTSQPKAQPGDSPHQRLEIKHQAGTNRANIILPSNLSPGHVIWLQPVVVNGAGETKWAPAVAFPASAPVDREPAYLALKHYWGARPLALTSVAKMKLGAGDAEATIDMRAKLTESMISQRDGVANMRMRCLDYEPGVPQEMLLAQSKSQLEQIKKAVRFPHANLTVDGNNNLKKGTFELPQELQAVRKDLTDLHSQIHESLEMLSVPLPGQTMQPGQSWKAKRPLMIFTGQRGNSAAMEVTYVFEGVRVQDGKSEGVITFSGLAKDRRVGDSVSGRINGTAFLDLSLFQISSATVNAELNMDLKSRLLVVALESKLERTLGKEVLHVRDRITDQDQLDANNRPFKVHTVHLEAGKPCVVSLESPNAKGPGYFDTFLRVEDANGTILGEDDDSGVDLNSMVVFTPQSTGTYRIVAKSFYQDGAPGDLTPTGNYLLVVRQ